MIFLSAGHYPQKPGAGFGNFFEHDEAVKWIEQIMTFLDPEVATVVPTGTLRDKVAFINNRMNGVYSCAVEIHFNSAKNSDGEHIGKGCETLYYPGSESGLKLARLLNQAMASVIERDRGVKEGWYRMDKRNGADFFLERTKCPAVILEPDFIHRRRMIEACRTDCCKAISAALPTAG